MTREEIEYMLKHLGKSAEQVFYEIDLNRRKQQERFIKGVPSYVPDKGVWVRTSNGEWKPLEEKFCGNEVKFVMNTEEMEKLKERSHKIAEIMLLKEYKMFKQYVMLEFCYYLERQNYTLEETKIEFENDIKDSNKNTMLHKWRKARAEVFLLLLDKIRQANPRLTDKSLASEVVEIVKNLKDIE